MSSVVIPILLKSDSEGLIWHTHACADAVSCLPTPREGELPSTSLLTVRHTNYSHNTWCTYSTFIHYVYRSNKWWDYLVTENFSECHWIPRDINLSMGSFTCPMIQYEDRRLPQVNVSSFAGFHLEIYCWGGGCIGSTSTVYQLTWETLIPNTETREFHFSHPVPRQLRHNGYLVQLFSSHFHATLYLFQEMKLQIDISDHCSLYFHYAHYFL